MTEYHYSDRAPHKIAYSQADLIPHAIGNSVPRNRPRLVSGGIFNSPMSIFECRNNSWTGRSFPVRLEIEAAFVRCSEQVRYLAELSSPVRAGRFAANPCIRSPN